MAAERQGLLRCTDGSNERVVLKRVKRRVEVRPWHTTAARGDEQWACCALRGSVGAERQCRSPRDLFARAPHNGQQPVLGYVERARGLAEGLEPGSAMCQKALAVGRPASLKMVFV